MEQRLVYELRGTDNALVGLFVDRAVALAIARQTLLTAPRRFATVVRQALDRRAALAAEHIIALKPDRGHERRATLER